MKTAFFSGISLVLCVAVLAACVADSPEGREFNPARIPILLATFAEQPRQLENILVL